MAGRYEITRHGVRVVIDKVTLYNDGRRGGNRHYWRVERAGKPLTSVLGTSVTFGTKKAAVTGVERSTREMLLNGHIYTLAADYALRQSKGATT